MKTLFELALGILFVTDAATRLLNLHRGGPLPVITLKTYRLNMHVNMGIGICLLVCVLAS